MLDAFIIEELRRREQEAERAQIDRSLRLPVPGADREQAPEPRGREHRRPASRTPREDTRDSFVVDFTL